ncbi:type I-E CRISPR-associated protein Cas7/Cse4/CasC [Quadrisphaera sp. DSM 44207]|uniref:type I-E CRISPR-associated protein Cas7/Cse4/CasC n=1 Tax=Quadrisphaera sp. DSM 44207 TaxID=1881057 RepID=UPI0008804C10|nr:type I-E CRISPR-associated protein Cas7/Cse4/CasC [Quadrisphaera sp. DSM 44207]SDQ52554.1 CRISPR-associated protein, Cse4 family [Quadrisphaera sp. DSM 44207]
MPRTFLDVHVLQTVPPSNLNRDDTGSPKTAYYGGVRRARVSSQAWKRATRKAFDELLDRDQLGVRTKRVVELVTEEIVALSPDLDEPQKHAVAVLNAAMPKLELKRPERKRKDSDDAKDEVAQSSYLIFLSRRQVQNLARLAVEAAGSGTKVSASAAKAAADSSHSVDVALFGRMVADATDINVDAAAQVAHAISVHAVDNEFDYFTAVDDRAPEDNAGAGMIGTVEFNSSTLYRYATVDVDALRRSLAGADGDADATSAAVEAFLRAFVTSMPTGKQNTFAHRTLPDAVLVQVREKQPVNLVGAFEDAVRAGEAGGRLAQAAARLAQHSRDVDDAYGGAPVASWVVRVGTATEPLEALGEVVGIDDLVTAVGDQVRDRAGAAV